MTRQRLLVSLALVLGLVASMAGLVPAARAVESNVYDLNEAYITSADGTQLQTFVYRPHGATHPTPVILSVTPYAGTGGNTVDQNYDPLGDPKPAPGDFAMTMLEKGYSYLVVSLRGYGGSGGCFDLGGAGEQADVKAAIAWAASQPWSTGKVGMVGHSYEGLTGLMGLASREPGLAAVVSTSPPAGYHNYFSHGLRETVSGQGFAPVYAASDLNPPSLYSPPQQHVNSLSGTASDPGCYATVTAGSYEPRQSAPYWVERDMVPKLAGTTVPTLLVQGFNDWQVHPNAVTDIWNALAGPRRLVLGPWDHGIASAGTAWSDEVAEWFDTYLAGAKAVDEPIVRIQSVDGAWRAESAWPPAHATAWRLPVLAGSYSDVAGNNGETGVPQLFPVKPPQPLPTGRGSWTFTPPLAADTHLTGVPSFEARLATLAPNVNVIVLVYDVAPDGTARFVTRGGAPAPSSGPISFTLFPLDWQFAAGHRVGVLVTGADDFWFESPKTGTPVTVLGGSLSVLRMNPAHGQPLASGPFSARTPHPPFVVPAATIAERTAS